MSNIYQTFNSLGLNYETPDTDLELDTNAVQTGFGPSAVDRDIDKALAYVKDNQNYYDYDLKSTPSLSGPQLLVPHKQDEGIPLMNFINESPESTENMVEQVNNGRIPDVKEKYVSSLPNQDINVINKDNNITAIKGIIEETALSDIFFSDMNMNVIQESVRYNVYKNTDKVVANQSEKTFYIIMRSIMLQYGNFQVSANNIIDEIKKLNKLVVDYASENVTSNVLQYVNYLDDIQKLPQPIERPVYNNKDNYTYDISNLL
tara:strand:- start:315 stop:1097 length:783 start_codon:yes stop_codon:yes gene_type:complete